MDKRNQTIGNSNGVSNNEATLVDIDWIYWGQVKAEISQYATDKK